MYFRDNIFKLLFAILWLVFFFISPIILVWAPVIWSRDFSCFFCFLFYAVRVHLFFKSLLCWQSKSVVPVFMSSSSPSFAVFGRLFLLTVSVAHKLQRIKVLFGVCAYNSKDRHYVWLMQAMMTAQSLYKTSHLTSMFPLSFASRASRGFCAVGNLGSRLEFRGDGLLSGWRLWWRNTKLLGWLVFLGVSKGHDARPLEVWMLHNLFGVHIMNSTVTGL